MVLHLKEADSQQVPQHLKNVLDLVFWHFGNQKIHKSGDRKKWSGIAVSIANGGEDKASMILFEKLLRFRKPKSKLKASAF